MSSAIKRMLAAVATVAVILTGTVVAQAPGQGRWTKFAPFPEPSQEIGGTSVNGKLYIIGGLPFAPGQSPAPKGIVWEYDGATDKWAKKKNMPAPAHHVAVTSYRGKLYVFGGGTQVEPGGSNWVPTNKAWEYDPAADTWRELAPMSTARGAAVAVEVGGKMYVIGGASVHPGQKIVGLNATVPHRALGTNEEYDPATDSWGLLKARMPLARSGTAYGTFGGKIYVAGGEFLDNDIVGTFRDLDAYDPAANRWTSFPPMPLARHGMVGGIITNRFHVVSGHLQSGAVFGTPMDSDANDGFELDR